MIERKLQQTLQPIGTFTHPQKPHKKDTYLTSFHGKYLLFHVHLKNRVINCGPKPKHFKLHG